MTAPVHLPERLDFPAAEALLTALKDARGTDLTLDGRGVAHLGAAAAQTLLVAADSWTKDGKAFAVTPISDAMTRDLAMLGLEACDIGAEGGA